MDLIPLPVKDQASTDGAKKAEILQRLHERVRHNIERRTETIAERFNRGRRKVMFEPGDWVWVHMRKERFPNSRRSKLHPRGDGPFQVAARINDNAYRLELPGDYNVSATFNVSDLSPFDFDAGLTDSRTNPFEEGGDDAISIEEGQATEKEGPSGFEPIKKRSPTRVEKSQDDYSGPMTRQRAKRLRDGLPDLIQMSRCRVESVHGNHRETRANLCLHAESPSSTE